MTTLSRATGKALLKSASGFKAVREMVSRAVDPTKPTLVKSLRKNRTKLDESFLDLCYSYDTYKADTLSSESIEEEEFNKVEEGEADFHHNDKWMEEMKSDYYTLVDASDEKLEEGASEDTLKRIKLIWKQS